MATRVVQITITGDSDSYAAAITRMIEKTDKFTNDLKRLDDRYKPVPTFDSVRESLLSLDVKDQQKIYEWLNRVCGRRMP